MRLLGWLLVVFLAIRVGLWALSAVGDWSVALAGSLASFSLGVLADVAVFGAYTLGTVVALGLGLTLVHGVIAFRDRRGRKGQAVRQARPEADIPPHTPARRAAPAPANTAPTPSPPAESGNPHTPARRATPASANTAAAPADAGNAPDLSLRPYRRRRTSPPPRAVGLGRSDDHPQPRPWSAGTSAARLRPNPQAPAPSAPRSSTAVPGPPGRPATPATDTAETAARTLLILGCRGVQAGNDNTQFNSYTYELQEPSIDFSAVLRKPEVREAFERLIMDPENEELRAAAEQALRAGRWGRPEVLDLGPLDRASLASGTDRDLKTMQGFITIRNCQGVQLGDECFQFNDFLYVCRRSTVDTHALLKGSSKVAKSLTEAVVPNPQSWGTAESLNATVKAALLSHEAVAAIPDRSVRVSRATNTVRDRDGVSIGSRCRTTEFKSLTVEVRKPSRMPDGVLSASKRLIRQRQKALRETPHEAAPLHAPTPIAAPRTWTERARPPRVRRRRLSPPSRQKPQAVTAAPDRSADVSAGNRPPTAESKSPTAEGRKPSRITDDALNASKRSPRERDKRLREAPHETAPLDPTTPLAAPRDSVKHEPSTDAYCEVLPDPADLPESPSESPTRSSPSAGHGFSL
ncbi:RIP homotypic interaction motif-containing protein [Streptomyces endophyticus]|uniref:Uncharacterized protein n=1 Tax=Streptomyces endophyticus TaxID=714166 RepID=A0ABU6FGI9_9ACTN|nr:RIP homotypic interaction motif-containing protein [Streptomyces endophyticus]MEB8342598.1 hypothetical protein [Streptomyces endophyticus]